MKKQILLKIFILFLVFSSGILMYQSFDKKTENEVITKKNKVKRTKRAKEYSEYFKGITTGLDAKESSYTNSYRYDELQKALQRKSPAKFDYSWINRGPANVGGRTRAIVIDPDDATKSTWFVGAATGGIWKTTNKGNNWTNISASLPNLSTNALEMAKSNHNVMYAGTGESFPGGTYLYGSGIFKTTNKGTTWSLLSATSGNKNFEYVNRIVIDFQDENILLAATNGGIFKSTDGGLSFTQKYSSATNVEQIIAEPGNFNIQYASVKGVGVLKSTDAGETWVLSNNQLTVTGRIELAISPVNTSNLFASVDGDLPSVYISRDKGASWVIYKQGLNPEDFLTQGAYDNAIAAHPFDQNSVYVAGVNINKINFSGTQSQSAAKVLSASTENTSSFLSFINFGGEFLNGGMAWEDGTNPIDVVASDWCSIEIRFGAGKKQKAHRFTVGGQGSGVAASGYFYKDYVDVPFEVWDITNNRQLMVSFRDQAENGVFDLVERDDADDAKGREYFFINAVAYSPTTPNSNIAKTGGRAYKQLYFFWPTLASGGTWDANNLPESKIIVKYGTQAQQAGTITKIADAYGTTNSYDQGSGFGKTKIPGLHPDHHQIVIIPGASSSVPFTIINTNDGGISISENSGTSFEMRINNYNTTQFYGVSKKHGASEYFGGMQDNGSWQSKTGEVAHSDSYYYFQIGGDGFETVWHYTNPNKMIGSVYYNDFSASSNGGISWSDASKGIDVDTEGNGDGPFLTKLSSSKSKADILYAVGKNGVWKNTTFGSTNWIKKLITTGWSNGSVTSYHSVKVSLANDNIVWAGAGMASAYGYNIFVSTDEGESFKAVKEYSDVTMNAYLSGFATHPTLDSTAFALFSVKGKPKILKTDDLGETWTDITGFSSGKGKSNNGFPDVVVNSLLVMPYNTDIIWAGTDIGMFETTDGGQSWHILAGDFPYVSVYQMQIVDDEVVVATHGRGIWTANIPEIRKVPVVTSFSNLEINKFKVDFELFDQPDSVALFVNEKRVKSANSYTNNSKNTFQLENLASGHYNAYVVAYISGKSYKSNSSSLKFFKVGIPILQHELKTLSIYPNPSKGFINFELSESDFDKEYSIKIVDLSGKEVLASKGQANIQNQLDASHLGNGHYIVMVYINKMFYVNKLELRK